MLPFDLHLAVALTRLHLARNQPEQAMPVIEHLERWARTDEQRADVQALMDEAKAKAAS